MIKCGPVWKVMELLKILILEDEQPQLDKLTSFLARYRQEEPGFEYHVETYSRGLELLDAYQCDADLIFLDIRVPDMLGVDVARRVREMDEAVMIVFVTSLSQYAVDGYSVRAFDYILKPVRYASFAAKLERALRVLSYGKREQMLELRTKAGGRRVPVASVVYVETAVRHDLLFHTGSEVIRQWGTLSQYEKQLQEAHFARPCSSFLVNLKYVRGVKKDTVMMGGIDAGLDEIPLSRSKRKDFLAALAQYKGGTA